MLKESKNRFWGTAVAQWLGRCATNRKVAGSIPDCVIEIFHWHNPSDRIMALGSTQTLTEISKGKGKTVPLQAWTGPEVS